MEKRYLPEGRRKKIFVQLVKDGRPMRDEEGNVLWFTNASVAFKYAFKRKYTQWEQFRISQHEKFVHEGWEFKKVNVIWKRGVCYYSEGDYQVKHLLGRPLDGELIDKRKVNKYLQEAVN